MSEEDIRKVIKVTVRLFGPLVDEFGVRELELPMTLGATIADLAAHLELAQALEQGVKVAQDGTFCPPDTELIDGAEVAFLPPVSGG